MVMAILRCIALIMLFSAISCGDTPPGPSTTPSDGHPLNERLTTAAWEAFNKGNYADAITAADKCIDEFAPAAKKTQSSLEGEKASVPNGKVTDEEKAKIFANGPLNDVATCWFIKGRSSEKLKHLDDAKDGYKSTMKYTYGRTWDPDGQFFWSPAETASERLDALN